MQKKYVTERHREKETLRNKYKGKQEFFMSVKPCTNFPIRAHIEVAPMGKFQMSHLVFMMSFFFVSFCFVKNGFSMIFR